MKNKLSILFVLLSIYSTGYAQPGGKSTYDFLNIPVTARISALGGALPVTNEGDINIAVSNPALINSSLNNNLVFNFLNYFAGIKAGYAGYSKTIEKGGSFLAGIQYINYGKFTASEPNGDITGTFNAGEYAVNLGWGKKIDSSFSIGTNLKTIYSYFERYNSLGLGMDLAANYIIPKYNFGFSLMVKNLGYELVSYTGNQNNLPLNIQFAVSKRLEHAPLQFTLMANNLNKLKLSLNSNLKISESEIYNITKKSI